MELTERVVNEVKESMVWKQVTKDVAERTALLVSDLATLNLRDDLVEASRHQGRIDGMQFVMNLLDSYKEEIIMNREEAKK